MRGILKWLLRKHDGAKQGQVAGCLEHSIEPFIFMKFRVFFFFFTLKRTVSFSRKTAAYIWVVVMCILVDMYCCYYEMSVCLMQSFFITALSTAT